MGLLASRDKPPPQLQPQKTPHDHDEIRPAYGGPCRHRL